MNSQDILDLYLNYSQLKKDYSFLEGLDLQDNEILNKNKKTIIRILELDEFNKKTDIEDKKNQTTTKGNIIYLNTGVKKLNINKVVGKILYKKNKLKKEIKNNKLQIDLLVMNNITFRKDTKRQK